MYLRRTLSLVLFVLLSFNVACAQETASSTKPSDEFHIGAFMVGPPHIKTLDAEFKKVKEYGFNYVHWYGISFHPQENIQRYMDLAHKNGLKVLLDVSKPLHDYAQRKKISKEQAMETFIKQTTPWKEHPALGMWYIYDEPHEKNITPKELQHFNRVLKRMTPKVKTSIALAWTVDWPEYLKCADIMMPDFYPVTSKEYPNNVMTYQAEFYSRVRATAKRPIMPFTQCFGFPNIPNAMEMRYICFSPLIDGVTGLYFWSYHFACKEPFEGIKNGKLDRKFLPETVAPVIKDIRQFVDLVAPVEKVQHLPRLKNPNYSTRQLLVGVWKRSGKAYIIAINNWPTKREVSIPFNGVLSKGKLAPILSTRQTNTEIKDSSAFLTMEPWETFIWQTDLR